jgi:hypothetical protein
MLRSRSPWRARLSVSPFGRAAHKRTISSRLNVQDVRLYDQPDKLCRDHVYTFDFDGRTFFLVGTALTEIIKNN